MAYLLTNPLLPVRKKAKLPFHTTSITYALEYGNDTVEIHRDAVAKDQHVLIVDDLLATGGTARATVDLVKEAGGRVCGLSFLIELVDLAGPRPYDYRRVSRQPAEQAQIRSVVVGDVL